MNMQDNTASAASGYLKNLVKIIDESDLMDFWSDAKTDWLKKDDFWDFITEEKTDY